MPGLRDISLLLPPLKKDEWHGAIENAEGLEKLALVSQWHLWLSLEKLKRTPVTPAKLGWLVFWTRAYSLVSAALGAWERAAPTELRVLERVTMELSTLFQFVTDPLAQEGSDQGRAEVCNRLNAYCAWCLWNDAEVYRHLLEPPNLEHLFDPIPSRDMIADLGPKADLWTAFTGQRLELLSDGEAALDRSRGETYFRDRLALFDRWLSDPSLAHWRGRLQSGNRQSFFHFAEGSRGGVNARLTAKEMGFAYAMYKRGSGAVHVCSLEGALHITPESVAPEFADFSDNATDSLRHVITSANLMMLPLAAVAGVISDAAEAGA